MKNTPFLKFHEALGARIIPFAGYNMPVEYAGITEEHITVREKVGVFDVSHMGEFWVTGPSAFKFIQYITSNDVSALFDGKIQPGSTVWRIGEFSFSFSGAGKEFFLFFSCCRLYVLSGYLLA